MQGEIGLQETVESEVQPSMVCAVLDGAIG